MSSRAPRAIVVGGSLGGLFAANLLLRAGWDVHVHERAREPLSGRGAGIVTHESLFRALERCGVAIDASLGCEVAGRIALAPDGSVIERLPLPQVFTAWGRLYSALDDAFPASRHHRDRQLERVEAGADRVVAHFADGSHCEADMLVAADGIRSTVRAQYAPQVQPQYAGYVAWRGLADERVLSPATHSTLFERIGFCLPGSEHMVGYPVAGPGNTTAPGRRCYNFVWYRPVAEQRELAAICTDASGVHHPLSIPPPLIRPEVVTRMREDARRLLAPQFAEIVEATHQPFFQPICDVQSTRTVFGRVALLGDAAFVARPHCGAGVSKAAEDAMTLVDTLAAAGHDVLGGLAAYEARRMPASLALVERARELGNALESVTRPQALRPGAHVHHTPRAVLREVAIPLAMIP